MLSIGPPRSTPFCYAAAIAALIFLTLAAVPNAGASAASASAADPAPSSTASAMPSVTPGVTASPTGRAANFAPRDGERLVVASCRQTVFYSWPEKDGAPAPAGYPPATNGDAFHIVGALQQSLDGFALYETTIEVVAPWGSGKHYWVAARCVNAG